MVCDSYAYAQNDKIIKSAFELDYPPFCIVTDQGLADGLS